MQLKKGPRESGFQPRTSRFQDEPGDEPSNQDYDTMYDENQPGRVPVLESDSDEISRTDLPAAAAARSESVIDANSQFDGRYETERDLRIQGTVSGEIVCRGLLTIEREASAKAKVLANEAHIKGRMEGDIVCSARLVIASTAKVSGTLKAPILVVEEGAELVGSIETVSAAIATERVAAPAATRPAPATPTPAPPSEAPASAAPARNGRREVPSFAIVSSDDRVALDRS